MKKLISLFTLIVLPILFSACSAEKFTEGKEYTIVNDTITAKPEVREYFSVYCPHCFKFQPFVERLEMRLPKGVKLEANHVDFLRFASPKVQGLLTKALVVAEQLKMKKKMTNALFNYIHVQRATITSEKDIRNIFVLNGADGAKFDKLMKSFSVVSKANYMKKQQDFFGKKGALTGVPTIIVNGKYRINPEKIERGKNYEKNYTDLVYYLLSLK